MSAVLVHGMHGLGDNLHQRAVVRGLQEQGHAVWLETPWPSVYHDMPDVRLLNVGSKLRTQAKNLQRERDAFTAPPAPAHARHVHVSYRPEAVRQHRGILAAMCAGAGVPLGDFRLPVPPEWDHGLDLQAGRPVLVLRPLVARREWGGCAARNPDAGAYVALLEALRDRFFVVSVADLMPGKEWLAQPDPRADLTLHAGELDFRGLAALWRDADMVMTSPGFGVALAQAVGTRLAIVFGGHEGSYTYDAGARYAPTLAIAPDPSCDCFSHFHACNKRIDLDSAVPQLLEFAQCPSRATAQA